MAVSELLDFAGVKVRRTLIDDLHHPTHTSRLPKRAT